MSAFSDGWLKTVGVVGVAVVCGYLVVNARSFAILLAAIPLLVLLAVKVEPRYLVVVAAVLVPVSSLGARSVGTLIPGNLAYADLALVAFVGSTLVRPAIRSPRGAALALVAFAGVALIVAMMSMVRSGYFDVGLLRIGRMVIVGLGVLGAVRSLRWDDVDRAVRAFIFSAAALSGVGIAAYVRSLFSRAIVVNGEVVLRLWGGALDPNYYGVLIAAAVVVVATWPPRERERGWWTAATVILSLALILTFSRAGVTAAAAGLVVVGLLAWVSGLRGQPVSVGRGLIAVAGVMLLGGLGLRALAPSVFEAVASRYATLGGGEADGSMVFRREIQTAALDVFSRNQLIGVGPGALSRVMILGGFFTRARVVHNSFIEMAAELGYLGVVPFVVMLVSASFLAVRRALDPDLGSGMRRIQLMSLVGAFVASVVGSLALSVALFSASFALLALLLAAACSDDSADAQQYAL